MQIKITKTTQHDVIKQVDFLNITTIYTKVQSEEATGAGFYFRSHSVGLQLCFSQKFLIFWHARTKEGTLISLLALTVKRFFELWLLWLQLSTNEKTDGLTSQNRLLVSLQAMPIQLSPTGHCVGSRASGPTGLIVDKPLFL